MSGGPRDPLTPPTQSYVLSLLSGGQTASSQRASLLADSCWIGGLAAAGSIVWRALAAHPALRLAVIGYLAAEGMFYLWGKLRWVMRGAAWLP